MSNTKMLIDATHPEETRVVVQRNGRVEEFDFESAARKLLRGNIYLAKVTRVEPSLQAAFVDYGGNRHGFLAFNEIHPDYYQIPVADRQALIDEEAAAEAELEAAADRRAEALAQRTHPRDRHVDQSAPRLPEEQEADGDAAHIVDVEEDEHIEEVGGEAGVSEPPTVIAAHAVRSEDVIVEPIPVDAEGAQPGVNDAGEEALANDLPAVPHADHHEAEDEDDAEGEADEVSDGEPDAGGELSVDEVETGAARQDGGAPFAHGRTDADFSEEATIRPRRRPRSYKIQEVIKRRQIILVQVVKEERGNKGAALTTYLSLAGRYTVLMPNTARGGGISRKITNPQDRKRLKSIAQDLDVPEGMGLIIRTAGAARTKQEIRRDFEYLLRLWESVRDLTLQSTAPSLVYEEGDLVKRSIRDLYNKDVEEIVVAGETGHQDAAGFMRMLMPSHTKNVIHYKDPTPLFTKYGVERQLNAMFLPQVTLRSGGYIVINQTEALVAIDVNSGKSTREFSIEETALATNLEAADEIARQLKLRDLAGLIVIDFIDMEEKRNNRAVERRLKDALRFDRARIQLGRISHFGLMEMSRQRLRTGVLEGSTSQCPHCQGTGNIRSTESIALAVLRGLEDAITAGANTPLIATTTPSVALYILNSKRAYVADMESRHGYSVTIVGSDRAHGASFTIDRGVSSALPTRRPERAAVNMNWGFESEDDEQPSIEADDISAAEPEDRPQDDGDQPRQRFESDDDGEKRGRRRRRGRGRGGRDGAADHGGRQRPAFEAEHGDGDAAAADSSVVADDAAAGEADGARAHADSAEAGDRASRKRRRGRRGGRRGRDRDGAEHSASNAESAVRDEQDDVENADVGLVELVNVAAPDDGGGATVGASGAARRSGRSSANRSRGERVWDAPSASPDDDARGGDAPAPATTSAAPALAPTRRHETGSGEPRIERVVVGAEQPAEPPSDAPAAQQRKGWWQRRFGAE